jgi:predicted enzyme related to lactoylglutathione lyase
MGKAVVHWELMSKDPARVSEFYETVFDWKVQHMPELNYRIVDTGSEDGINGGIVKPGREGPWPATCCSTSPSMTSLPTATRSSLPAARSMSKSKPYPVWDPFRFSPIPRAA